MIAVINRRSITEGAVGASADALAYIGRYEHPRPLRNDSPDKPSAIYLDEDNFFYLSEDPTEQAQERALDLARLAQHGNIQKPIAHLVLSSAPEDQPLLNPQLSPGALDLWRRMTREYVTQMGYGNSPWIAYLHLDGKSELAHAHVLTVQRDLNLAKVPDLGERRRAHTIARSLEDSYNLRRVAREPRDQQAPTSYTRSVHHQEKRQDLDLVRLRAIVKNARSRSTNLPDFFSHLTNAGLKPYIYIRHGAPAGWGIRLPDGSDIAGARIAKAHSWPKLRADLSYRLDQLPDLLNFNRIAGKVSTLQPTRVSDQDALNHFRATGRAIPFDAQVTPDGIATAPRPSPGRAVGPPDVARLLGGRLSAITDSNQERIWRDDHPGDARLSGSPLHLVTYPPDVRDLLLARGLHPAYYDVNQEPYFVTRNLKAAATVDFVPKTLYQVQNQPLPLDLQLPQPIARTTLTSELRALKRIAQGSDRPPTTLSALAPHARPTHPLTRSIYDLAPEEHRGFIGPRLSELDARLLRGEPPPNLPDYFALYTGQPDSPDFIRDLKAALEKPLAPRLAELYLSARGTSNELPLKRALLHHANAERRAAEIVDDHHALALLAPLDNPTNATPGTLRHELALKALQRANQAQQHERALYKKLPQNNLTDALRKYALDFRDLDRRQLPIALHRHKPIDSEHPFSEAALRAAIQANDLDLARALRLAHHREAGARILDPTTLSDRVFASASELGRRHVESSLRRANHRLAQNLGLAEALTATQLALALPSQVQAALMTPHLAALSTAEALAAKAAPELARELHAASNLARGNIQGAVNAIF